MRSLDVYLYSIIENAPLRCLSLCVLRGMGLDRLGHKREWGSPVERMTMSKHGKLCKGDLFHNVHGLDCLTVCLAWLLTLLLHRVACLM